MTGARFRSLAGGLTRLSGLLMPTGSCPQSERATSTSEKRTQDDSASKTQSANEEGAGNG